MQHDLRGFPLHGGSGQYVLARRNGTVFGYRAGISIKSAFPGYAEPQAQADAAFPFARGDPAAAQGLARGRGRDRQPEPVLRADQRAGIVRAFRSLDAITGGDEAVARRWLSAPNTALAARPVERMVTVQGLVDVAAYLDMAAMGFPFRLGRRSADKDAGGEECRMRVPTKPRAFWWHKD